MHLIFVFSAGHADDDWLFSIQITWTGAGWRKRAELMGRN